MRKPDRPGRSKQLVRVCCENFAEDPVIMVFSSHLRRSFNYILEVVGTMESEWVMLHVAIVKVAARSCDSKVTANPRTRW